jgi:CheY-like chemotaxis protein
MSTDYFKNIVLADDDEDDCLMFKDVLSELELKADVALFDNGHDLLHFLFEVCEDCPDIIFLDLNMPRRNGIDCLSEIRSIPKYQEVPIIVLSTSAHGPTVQKAFENGATLFVQKPDTFHRMRNILHKTLLGEFPTPPQIDKFLVSD